MKLKNIKGIKGKIIIILFFLCGVILIYFGKTLLREKNISVKVRPDKNVLFIKKEFYKDINSKESLISFLKKENVSVMALENEGNILDMGNLLFLILIFLLFIILHKKYFLTKTMKLKYSLKDRVHPKVLKEVLKNSLANINPKWEKQETTILSVKISGEPNIKLETMRMLFKKIKHIILQHFGTIGNFSGNEITAYWGAPLQQFDHAPRACMAAIGIKDFLEQIKEEAKGVIGICTGKTRIGFVEEKNNFNFILLGKNEEFSKNLQRYAKKFGVPILIDEKTLGEAAFWILTREVARTEGRNGTKIYELLGRKNSSEENKDFLKAYRKGFEAYQKKQWQQGVSYFYFALQKKPEDKVAKTYLEKCREEQKKKNINIVGS